MVKKMFIEIKLCNSDFKGQFDVSILNRLKIMGFFVNAK